MARPGEAMPRGLCADRADHRPHPHGSATLGWFWCTADQSTREPNRSQRRQDAMRRGVKQDD